MYSARLSVRGDKCARVCILVYVLTTRIYGVIAQACTKLEDVVAPLLQSATYLYMTDNPALVKISLPKLVATQSTSNVFTVRFSIMCCHC